MSGEPILIVDDNPVNLGVVVDHLEEHGYEGTVALGGVVLSEIEQFFRFIS